MTRQRIGGGVYLRGATYWIWYRVEGERIYESARTGDKREAGSLLALRRREIREGTWTHPSAAPTSRRTVAGYLDGWIARRREAGVRNVADEELWMREHVIPAIGAMELRAVQRTHVRDLVTALSKKTSARTKRSYSPRTILHVYRTLTTAFADAVLDGLIASTPCTLRTRKGELPKLRDADPKWRASAVYTRDEAEILLGAEALPLDRRVFYGLMLLAGLRTSEAAAVRWSSYDASAAPLGRLTVETQADGTKSERETKTGETRDVPVIAPLAALLAEWKLGGFAKLFGRPPRPGDPIVPSRMSKGRRYTFRSISASYGALVRDLERLELRRVPALRHSMRATFLTLLEADGANMAIARRATHSAPSDVVAGYVRTSWADLCHEIGKLRIEPRRPAEVIPLRVTACDKICDSGGPETRKPRKTGAIVMGDTGVEAPAETGKASDSENIAHRAPIDSTPQSPGNTGAENGTTHSVTRVTREEPPR